MRRRLAPAAVLTAVAGLAFVVWTALVFRTRLFASWDASALTPGLAMTTAWGQLTAACSFLFHPYVSYGVLLILALWAWRRRLRNLALACAGAIPIAWLSTSALKYELGRPRPPTTVPLVTAEGLGYPSAHMAAISALAVLGIAAAVVIRRNGTLVWMVAAGGIAVWFAAAYNRWALRAQFPTDIVGGGLWGVFVGGACLLGAGVRVVAPWPGRARPGLPPRIAVVVNPTKVPDWEHLRKHVDGAARGHGWRRPMWLETSHDDAGLDAARRAIESGADVVLASGGDGTIRSVCQALSGSGVALAVLPAGTGNLLARNLGIPLDLADAIDTAFDGVPRSLDLVEVRADGGHPQACAVMAGMGLDAIVMGATDPDLKRAVGPAAYVVSALGAMSRPPFELTTSLDAAPPVSSRVGLAMIANVGQLQAGIQLVPDARPDDGLLDLLLADAHGLAGWAGMAGQVVSGASEIGGLKRAQARTVVFEADEPIPYQIDGDTLGSCRRLEASVVHGALTVMLPR